MRILELIKIIRNYNQIFIINILNFSICIDVFYFFQIINTKKFFPLNFCMNWTARIFFVHSVWFFVGLIYNRVVVCSLIRRTIRNKYLHLLAYKL
ncbi:hypothetical protein HK20_06370 [Acetobacter sp. DsW_54]|nr:hypothetical protein HK20_06370 [Acetobacter sp. DsW_54]